MAPLEHTHHYLRLRPVKTAFPPHNPVLSSLWVLRTPVYEILVRTLMI